MPLWDLPREMLGQIGETVPDGFIRADEVMEFALPAIWGENFVDAAMATLPIGIEHSLRLKAALDNGRAVGVAKSLKEALTSGSLLSWEFRRRENNELSPPARIPAGDWSVLEPASIVYVLLTGTGDPLLGSMPRWQDQPVVAFKVDDAEAWLDSLEAASALPRLNSLSSDELPYDNVSLSTALSWRAGQTATHWYDVQSMGGAIRDTAAEIEAFPEDYSPRPEFDELCYDLADRLAARLRRNLAALELLRLMAKGNLEAWGVRRPGHSDLEKIEQEEFKVRREIVAFEDRLIPGKSTDVAEQGIAVRQGTWKHVRFLRSDLLAAFSEERTEPTSAGVVPSASLSEPQLPVRPRQRISSAKAAIRDLLGKHEDGPRPMSAAEAETWLRRDFDLSRDAARNMWKEMTPASWRRRGAPKKSAKN